MKYWLYSRREGQAAHMIYFIREGRLCLFSNRGNLMHSLYDDITEAKRSEEGHFAVWDNLEEMLEHGAMSDAIRRTVVQELL